MVRSQAQELRRIRTSWIAGTILPNAALGGFAFFVASVISLDVLNADTNPVATPISLYVLGSHGYLMTAAFGTFGLATVAVAISLLGHRRSARVADGDTSSEFVVGSEGTSRSYRRVLLSGGAVILAAILITVRAGGAPFVIAFFAPATVATLGFLARPRPWLTVTSTLVGLTALVALLGAGEIIGLAEPVSLTFASTVLLLVGLLSVLPPWVRSLRADSRLPDRQAGGGLLGTAGICIVLVALFPTDAIAEPGTENGLIHLILSFEAVLAITGAMLVIGVSPQDATWSGAARRISTSLAFAGAFLLVVGFALIGTPVHGLAERLSILVDVGWLALLAVVLRTAAQRSDGNPV